jgi:hypothetical protein
MKIFSYKICRENQNTNFTFYYYYFFLNGGICEITWKNIVEPDRPQMTVWRMRISRSVPKAKDTTLGICNTYCFPNATNVAQPHLSVTLPQCPHS